MAIKKLEIAEDTEVVEDPVDDATSNISQQQAWPTEYTGKADAAVKKRTKGVKLTRIVVDDNDDIPPSGLFVGVNGKNYMIQTGVEVDVPEPLLEVLDNAVMSMPVTDPRTKKVVGYRDRTRYTYRRV